LLKTKPKIFSVFPKLSKLKRVPIRATGGYKNEILSTQTDAYPLLTGAVRHLKSFPGVNSHEFLILNMHMFETPGLRADACCRKLSSKGFLMVKGSLVVTTCLTPYKFPINPDFLRQANF